MAFDYYKVLQIDKKTASRNKKGLSKTGRKYHPDLE
jgi:DnaJ-class molecular chaperone